MTKQFPYYLAGEAVFANTDLKVTDKYSGEVAYEVPLATPDVLDQAIAAAVDATDAIDFETCCAETACC